MMDSIFERVTGTGTGGIYTVSYNATALTASIAIGVALLLGLVLAATYMLSGRHTKSFAATLVMLPPLVSVVILLVSGSLGMAIAVAGSFALVRFRSMQGTAREICTVFFAMTIGLMCGTGVVWFAIAVTVFMCVIMLVIGKTAFGSESKKSRSLRILISESLNYTDVFDDIFEKYTSSYHLDRVRTTNLGSMFDLKYEIVLKDVREEKNMIDELRVRNGNLPISCAYGTHRDEEL